MAPRQVDAIRKGVAITAFLKPRPGKGSAVVQRRPSSCGSKLTSPLGSTASKSHASPADAGQRCDPKLAPRAEFYPKPAQGLQGRRRMLSGSPYERQTRHRQRDPKVPAGKRTLGSSSLPGTKHPTSLKRGQTAASSAQCLAATPRVSLVPRAELGSAPRARKLEVKRLQRLLEA